MIQATLDHIVIGAASLEQGIAYIQDTLGVCVPNGGEHCLMGTHNCVMSLGGSLYFEIIAINPAADKPDRPCWFGLGDPGLQMALAEKPRLLTWVVNVPDISRLNLLYFGDLLTMTRDNLKWMITVPENGSIPGNGFLPTVIQWQTDRHPSSGMADLGCTLVKLDIFHKYSRRFMKNLESLSADRLVTVHPIGETDTPYMEAHIRTPSGEIRTIRTP